MEFKGRLRIKRAASFNNLRPVGFSHRVLTHQGVGGLTTTTGLGPAALQPSDESPTF